MKKENLEQFRIVVNKQANEKLEEMVEKIKQDCESVSLDRSDLANYVFMNLNKLLGEVDIKKIRNLYFDEERIVKMMARRLKMKEALSDNAKKMLRDYYDSFEKNTNDIPKAS